MALKVRKCGLVLLLLMCACASHEARPSVTGDASCILSRQLEAATRDVDPIVRRAAAYVLGRRGQGRSIDVVGALITDPEESVRTTAIGAVADMRKRGGDYGPRVAELLCPALRDKSSAIRYSALYRMAECQGAAIGQAEVIRQCLDDDAPSVQLMAAYALGRIGADDGLEKRIVDLLTSHSGGQMDTMLGPLLEFIHDRNYVGVVERLLQSTNARVRLQAACAMARLGEGDDQWNEIARIEAQWREESQDAESALMQAPWDPVPRSEVLARVGEARLVLYGEMHESEGHIRANQREVLRAFVKDPAFEALGYEPSVAEAQSSMLELASLLGLTLIPLETDWRTLAGAGRNGAREGEVIDAIESYLRAHPSNRMMVLRGEAHVLPGGYLVRRLSLKPLILLSGVNVNVPVCVWGLSCNGSTFRIGTTDQAFVLPYDAPSEAAERATLSRWLAAH